MRTLSKSSLDNVTDQSGSREVTLINQFSEYSRLVMDKPLGCETFTPSSEVNIFLYMFNYQPSVYFCHMLILVLYKSYTYTGKGIYMGPYVFSMGMKK